MKEQEFALSGIGLQDELTSLANEMLTLERLPLSSLSFRVEGRERMLLGSPSLDWAFWSLPLCWVLGSVDCPARGGGGP